MHEKLILSTQNIVGLKHIHSMCKETSVYFLVFFFLNETLLKKISSEREQEDWIVNTEVCACETQSINLWIYTFKQKKFRCGHLNETIDRKRKHWLITMFTHTHTHKRLNYLRS